MATSKHISDRIGEIAFDLQSISVTLGFAADALADCDDYGMAETPNGVLMSNVGQILIDVRQRLDKYRDELSIALPGAA